MNWLRVGTFEEQFTDDEINPSEIRRRIEGTLSRLIAADHLGLLVGSGFTIGAGALAKVHAPAMDRQQVFGELQDSIDQRARQTAAAMGRGDANLEDQIRAAQELQVGLAILGDKRAAKIQAGIETILKSLANEILKAERDIRTFIENESEEAAFLRSVLQSFLMSFASRVPSQDRLAIFTTNYDRLIEYACDMTGLRLLDRFIGHLEPQFRSSRVDVDYHYNPPGIRGEPRYLEGVARITKLHGSIDWLRRNGSITRQPIGFGAPEPAWTNLADSLMVFPNAAKDVETAAYPYSELFRDMSAAICRPNAALVTYGYGFGDDHVNRVLRDMLTIPSTHLMIISYGDPDKRIERFVRSVARPQQITALVGGEFGALDKLVGNYLPRPPVNFFLAPDRQQDAAVLPEAAGRETSNDQA